MMMSFSTITTWTSWIIILQLKSEGTVKERLRRDKRRSWEWTTLSRVRWRTWMKKKRWIRESKV